MSTIKFRVLLLIIAALPSVAFCQTLFQDASGKSNLYFGKLNNAWVTYNTSDKSGTIGYVRNNNTGYDLQKHWGLNYDFMYGGDVKVNVKDGVGNLISGGAFKPGVTAEGVIGITSDHWHGGNWANFFLSPSLSYTQYNYLDSGTTKVNKLNKWAAGCLLNIDLQFNIDDQAMTKRHYFFLGIQTGYSRQNNYNDLDDVELDTRVAGDSTTTVYSSQTAKSGSYKGYNTMPLNIDFGVTPRMFQHNYFGFNAYLRTNIFKDKNTVNLGTGIYLADDQKPNSVSGGIAWQFNDVGNALNKTTGLVQRSSLFLYVGYSIGK